MWGYSIVSFDCCSIYIYYLKKTIHMYTLFCFLHTYIHAYIHTCMHACMHSCMHACIHSFMHTYIHVSIYCHQPYHFFNAIFWGQSAKSCGHLRFQPPPFMILDEVDAPPGSQEPSSQIPIDWLINRGVCLPLFTPEILEVKDDRCYMMV